MARGICSGCLKERALTGKGMIWSHGPCEGGGQPPVTDGAPATAEAVSGPVDGQDDDFLMGGGRKAAAPADEDDWIMDSGPDEAETRLFSNKRYRMPDPVTGVYKTWTRATTMAETISDLYSLNLWRLRMATIGYVRHPHLIDELRERDYLDAKEHRDLLNDAAGKAQWLAGSKVSANWGTTMHTQVERWSRGEISIEEADEGYRDELKVYVAAMNEWDLSPVPELIERRVALPLYNTAGTLDQAVKIHRSRMIRFSGRTARLKSGEHIIGDVKGLALTERIPTPDGWTTMGRVQAGDTVFDAYGQPCRVSAKSETKRIGTYVVRFDDGSRVVCDREHIWWTATGTVPGDPEPRPISEVIGALKSKWNQCQHRVPVAAPLDLPEADLPMDPYLLGCWLGDGHARSGVISKGRDLFEILQADGHALGVEQVYPNTDQCIARTVLGLTAHLRRVGLLHNKHIPAAYLRASVNQRVRLLQGLMDTDGTWNTARHSAAFSTTDKGLALQVEELMLSLGQRPHVAYCKRSGFGLTVDSWTVEITPVDLQPFRLPRKADQAAASVKPVTRSRRRVIVSVEDGPDVETACITVESPTSTYLCGDRMIPTHNSGKTLDLAEGEIAIQMAIYAHALKEGRVLLWDPEAVDPKHGPGGSWVWEKIGIPVDSIRTDVGVVMHMPVDRPDGEPAKCTLSWVDLKAGWDAVQLCESVRDWRRTKGLFTPVSVSEVVDHKPVVRDTSWPERFGAVTSKDQARALYREYVSHHGKGQRADDLVKIAKAHLASLTEASA